MRWRFVGVFIWSLLVIVGVLQSLIPVGTWSAEQVMSWGKHNGAVLHVLKVLMPSRLIDFSTMRIFHYQKNPPSNSYNNDISCVVGKYLIVESWWVYVQRGCTGSAGWVGQRPCWACPCEEACEGNCCPPSSRQDAQEAWIWDISPFPAYVFHWCSWYW